MKLIAKRIALLMTCQVLPISSDRKPGLRVLRSFICICTLAFFTSALGAQTVTVTNVPNNHYHYNYFPGDCPSGYNIPSGQYSSTYHLENGHAIHHLDPANATNDYWVYWVHFDNSSYGTAEVAVFKSTTECGPYILQTWLSPIYNVDGQGYGFRPGGWQSRDNNIFRDNDQTYNPDGTVASYASAYLISASNDLGTQTSSRGTTCNYANDSMAIFKMTPDYLGIDASTNPSTNGANWVFVCDQREAPVMFRKGDEYFLVTSQAAGWFPSQAGYAASNSPLTGWTPDPVALGNTSTFAGQTARGFTIAGTQDNTYVLVLNHLGGNLGHDTGSLWLPLILDDGAQTATLDWYTSWQVDTTTGTLSLPGMVNLALSGTASATSSAPSNPPSLANDGVYTTRWQAANNSFPASWTVDLGSPQAIQEVNLSWYMVKGSEPYYKYTIDYSLDGSSYTTLDHTNNIVYGFTNDSVNFTARYVRITETGYVCQNGCSFYSPSLMEAQIVQAPPSQNLPVTVTVTPSATTVPCGQTVDVTVAVSGGDSNPTPTGKVTLTGPGYTSDTYGLLNGSATFRVPAYAMDAGYDTITATYLPDPTSAATYGVAPTTGSSPIVTYGFGDCALLSRRQPVTASSSQPGNVPANGNDGDLNTRWVAVDGTYPQWWRVDLGSVLPLNQVVTHWYSSGGRAYQYTIDISNDDFTYTTIVDNTANTTSGKTTDNFSASARYVRVAVTGVTPAGGWAAFWECQIYGTLTPPPLLPAVSAIGDRCVYNGRPCSGSGSATGINGEHLGPVQLNYRAGTAQLTGQPHVRPFTSEDTR